MVCTKKMLDFLILKFLIKVTFLLDETILDANNKNKLQDWLQWIDRFFERTDLYFSV
jgi:hypothetical protein